MVAGVGQLGRLSVLLELNAARFQAGIQKVERKLNSFERGVKRLSRNLSAGFAAVGVVQLGRSAVRTSLQFERMETALTSVMGTQEAAAKEMEFLKKTTDELGISLLAAGTGYAKFAASTKGTQLEGEQTRKIFTSVSKAARALALSADDTAGIFRALTQVVSKGRVQAEELRGQIGERLPGAFQLAADAMGVTTEQLNKMMELGQVTAEDMLPKLADALENKYGKAAERASKGTISNFERFNNVLVDVANTVSEVLLPVLEALAKSFITAWNFAKNFFELSARSFKQLIELAKEYTGLTEIADPRRDMRAMKWVEDGKYSAEQLASMLSNAKTELQSLQRMALVNQDLFGDKNYLKQMDELRNRIIVLSDAQKDLGVATDETKNEFGNIIPTIADTSTTVEKAGKSFSEFFKGIIPDAMESVESFYDDIESLDTVMSDNTQTLKNLETALDLGIISWGTYSKAVFEAEGYTDEVKQTTEKTTRSIFDLGEALRNVQNNIQTGFSDLFNDLFSGKGVDSFKDFAKRVLDIFKRLLADMAAAWAASKIFDLDFDLGGGLLGKIFSGNSSTATKSPAAVVETLVSKSGLKGIGGKILSTIKGVFSGGSSTGGLFGGTATPATMTGSSGAGGVGKLLGNLKGSAGALVPAAIFGFGMSRIAASRQQKIEANQRFQGLDNKTFEELSPVAALRGIDDQTGKFFLAMNEGFEVASEALAEMNIILETQGALYDQAGNEIYEITGNVQQVEQALRGAALAGMTGFEAVNNSFDLAAEKGEQLKIRLNGNFDAIKAAMEAASASGIGGFRNIEQTASGATAVITGDILRWREFLEGFVKMSLQDAINGVGSLEGSARSATQAFIDLAAAASSVSSGGSVRAAVDGKHAAGARYIPHDNYIGVLHRGEKVQTAPEVNRDQRNQSMGGGRIEVLLQKLIKVVEKNGISAEGLALA